MEPEMLVHEYLGRLEAAAWPLPAERRRELAGEVQEHIEAALAEAGRRDEVAVRNVLERLGPPEDIVAAEAEPGTARPPHAAQAASADVRRSPLGPLEIAAVLLMTVGAVVLPIIGPLIGLVFVSVSTRWSPRVKVVAFGIGVLLVFLPVVLLFSAGGP